MKQRLPAKILLINTLKEILPAVIILGIGILAVPCLLVYKVSNPKLPPEPLDPSYHLLQYSDVRILSTGGNEINGWWIPGAKLSPGIVLVPGFGMNRSDALSLATVLHKRGFNVLIYGPRGSASSQKASAFGLKEVQDLLSVLEFIQRRPESDPERIGIWGVDVGAYSALQAAATLDEVKAVAADNVFESSFDFLEFRIEEEFGLENAIVQFGCRQIYRLFHFASGSLSFKGIPVDKLLDCSLLIIIGENRMRLGRLTTALYEKLSSDKEMISFETSRIHLMKETEFEGYDTRVADFFVQHLQ